MTKKYIPLDIGTIRSLHQFGGLMAYQAVYLDTVLFSLVTKKTSFDEAAIDGEIAQLKKAGFPARKREFLISFDNAFSQKNPLDLKSSVKEFLAMLKTSEFDLIPQHVAALSLALESGDDTRLVEESKSFILKLNQEPSFRLMAEDLINAAIQMRDAISGPSNYVMPPPGYTMQLENLVREMSAALPGGNWDLLKKAKDLLEPGDAEVKKVSK